jgi:molybdopterin synthase sulfur carrier subunit
VPRVELTPHLRRYFPSLPEAPFSLEGRTVAEVVRALDARYPGIGGYIVDDRGALRRHVNIFVGPSRVKDRDALSDGVADDGEVFILQALSGG